MDALSYDLIRWLLLDHLQDWLVGFASCARLVGLGEVSLLWGHPCTFDGHSPQAGHSPLLVPLSAVENKGLAFTLHKAKSSEVVEGKGSFHSCCGKSDRRFFFWLLWQKWQAFLFLIAVAKVAGVSFFDCCGKSGRCFFFWLLWQKWQVFLSLAAVAKVTGIFFLSCCGKMAGVSFPDCCGKSDRHFFTWLVWQKWQVFLSLTAVAKVTGISLPDWCGKSGRCFFPWLLWQKWQVFLSLAALAKVTGVSFPGCCGKSGRCFSYKGCKYGEKTYFLHTINTSHAVAQTPCVYCMEKTNLF